MQSMKKALKDYFTFSSRERTGMLVLLMLIILAITANFWLRYFPASQKEYDYTAFNREMDLFRSSLSRVEAVPDIRGQETDPSGIRPFPFDPNTATVSEMVRLGVAKSIAIRIQTYRTKGGRFKKKEDLLKIYGFDTAIYTVLSPYVNIPDENEQHHPHVNDPSKHGQAIQHYRIEINSSDSSGLNRLEGIGPVLASRIMKYRGLLGGYYSVDQLTEVYGISDSLYNAIKEHVYIDPLLVSKISINKAGEAQLSKHPYIGRYTAKAILSYRKSAGTISGIEELVYNKIITGENKKKIEAYLDFSRE